MNSLETKQDPFQYNTQVHGKAYPPQWLLAKFSCGTFLPGSERE